MVKGMKFSSRDSEDKKIFKRRVVIKTLVSSLLSLTIIWAGFTTYEYTRVINDKDTLLCFNKVKEIEDEDEYSITCIGLLYKYRKYYYIESNNLSARAFAMVFNDFERE